MAGTFYNSGEKDFIYAFKDYWFQAYMPDCCNMAFSQWAYKGLDLVLRFSDSPVWDCGVKEWFHVEG